MKTRVNRMLYVDFYAGKGRYVDGTASTPILVLQTVLKDAKLRTEVIAYLGDEEPECVEALKENIAALEGIETLKFPPQVSVQAASESGFEKAFEKQSIVPTFMFLDPFGYKGVTVKLIRSVLKDWGCDVVFFFCFNRMHGAIRNPKVRAHMDDLFGSARVDALRALLPTLKTPIEKETAIIGALEDSLMSIGGKYVQTFRFRDEHGKVTHHLVHVTKAPVAHEIVKGIMAKESSVHVDDVANFEFQLYALQPLFATSPIELLMDNLLVIFRGQTLTIADIVAKHHYKTNFIKRNYQEALRRLCYDRYAITAERRGMKPPLKAAKRDMPFDETLITFP